MPKKRLDTSFEKWINLHGTKKLAEILGLDIATVRHWRLGNALPRAHQMKKIKELTKGKIGYDQIIDGSCSPLNR